MKLELFKTLWGFTGTYQDAIEQAISANFHGLEGPAPTDVSTSVNLATLLDENKLNYIAEITTAGSYVPDRFASLQSHLDSLEMKIEHSLRMDPLFITCLGGCDAWEESLSIEFFSRAIEIANSYNIIISFETHRGRSFFNPWVTKRIVDEIPDIKITCDFSHWCVVCERLLDTEIDIIQSIAKRAHHIHARVGYDQGPQVPHPADPVYSDFLKAHQSWWELIWQEQLNSGYTVSTMTPEFGPDGYLQHTPFTNEPVADLWELNKWMGSEELKHFSSFFK